MICLHSRWQKLAMLGVTLLICASVTMAQAKFAILHNFGGTGDGKTPLAQLTEGEAGNLYGTTVGGGAYGDGGVFQLSRSGSAWNETVVYSFQGNNPTGAGLVADGSGNLFGTATAIDTPTIFELSPSDGSWVYTALYQMPEASDPGGLLLGRNGELYGTAMIGEFAYEVHPSASGGKWTGGILFTFNAGSDGKQPLEQGGSLIVDRNGNLYGTTAFGGAYNYGTVFELSPPAAPGDPWTETVLYSFGAYGTDGIVSDGAVVMDAAGNLYGTTVGGGTSTAGTVWELSPPASEGQPWTETILHSFAGGASDGSAPYTGLTIDKSGNLYGVTYYGGNGPCDAYPGCGTVFEVSPAGDGTWTETLLHAFQGSDGELPYGALMLSNHGYLYGTASKGGKNKGGTLFEIQP
jgi:uncharacterized repeat protein (TIGR03803 family)